MKALEVFIIGLGLSMDVFAVSICKGLSLKKITQKEVFLIAIFFALFQGLTPVVGYYLGSAFKTIINNVDHWIALTLLVFIGINMIKEAFNKEEINDKIDFKTMIVLALATSVDAIIVGVTFAFQNTDIIMAATILGIMALVISSIGVIIGNKFGSKYENKTKIVGGIILILMGVKILLKHLGVL